MNLSQTLDLETADPNIVLHYGFNLLKIKTTKQGDYHYIPVSYDISKRRVSDILKLANDFYNSPVDYLYLITLPYDELKFKTLDIYTKRGYVLWRDLIGPHKFKKIITDCGNQKAIELVLEYE